MHGIRGACIALRSVYLRLASLSGGGCFTGVCGSMNGWDWVFYGRIGRWEMGDGDGRGLLVLFFPPFLVGKIETGDYFLLDSFMIGV